MMMMMPIMMIIVINILTQETKKLSHPPKGEIRTDDSSVQTTHMATGTSNKAYSIISDVPDFHKINDYKGN